jgi:Ni/Fe-hydrogenase subunit HybB-like protein
VTFIIWIGLLLGGLYCWLTNPEVFANAHLIGLVAVVIAVVLVLVNIVALLLFRKAWNDQNERFGSRW